MTPDLEEIDAFLTGHTWAERFEVTEEAVTNLLTKPLYECMNESQNGTKETYKTIFLSGDISRIEQYLRGR